MSRFAQAIAVLAILAPLATAEEPHSFAPEEVVATPTRNHALVAWAPGEALADSYRVYGLNPGEDPEVLFDSATAGGPRVFATMVPAGYATYAVAGVLSDVESVLVVARSGPCEVIIDTEPPNVGTNCIKVYAKFRRPLT